MHVINLVECQSGKEFGFVAFNIFWAEEHPQKVVGRSLLVMMSTQGPNAVEVMGSLEDIRKKLGRAILVKGVSGKRMVYYAPSILWVQPHPKMVIGQCCICMPNGSLVELAETSAEVQGKLRAAELDGNAKEKSLIETA